MRNGDRKSGFTLIELMVVVIIIAALAAMVLPHVLPASNEAKAKIAKADIAGIELALKMFRLHHNRYPTTAEGLDILIKPPASEGWKEPFLEKKPLDPWKQPYKYACPGARGLLGFDIWSIGADGKEGTEDDINNWD